MPQVLNSSHSCQNEQHSLNKSKTEIQSLMGAEVLLIISIYKLQLCFNMSVQHRLNRTLIRLEQIVLLFDH